MDPPTRVFISDSHDSDAHRERVLQLCERLRRDGIETILDRYVEGSPPQGWPRWMLDGLDAADRVLVICTGTYYRRFRGHEVPGQGKGADWEGAIITQALYDARSATTRFVPVLLDSADADQVPEPLRAQTRYCLQSEADYQALCDALLGQSGIGFLLHFFLTAHRVGVVAASTGGFEKMRERPSSAGHQGVGFTRRDFSIALGSVATAVISGYFLFHRAPPAQPEGESTSARPRLRADVRRSGLNDFVLLEHGEGPGLVVCGVNPVGARILAHLDGEHRIERIAELAAGGSTPLPPAEVACFVAQLGIMGFLDAPYYAVIFERLEPGS